MGDTSEQRRCSVQRMSKAEKESFYSALEGTTTVEVLSILSVLPLTHLLFSTLPRRKTTGFLLFLKEYLLWTVPIVLVFTAPTGWLSVALIFYACTVSLVAYSSSPPNSHKHEAQKEGSNHIPFVSHYRALMMLCTLTAILAVDFRSFPRRLAKTESYGVSLMDVGVGTFQFAGALTSRYARGVFAGAPRLRVLRSALVSSLPVLVLGLARLASVKATDYHEHVSEYGVHWNFFFTLVAVNLIVSAINPRHDLCFVSGLVLLVAYQTFLSVFGGNEYLLGTGRANLIDQNKEGIWSSVGYVCLFLFGSHIGWKLQADPKSRPQLLLLYQLLFWLFYTASRLVDEPSRRMANMPYVFQTVASNLFILTAFSWLGDRYGNSSGRLLEAINRNQLVLFLVGNLLTGAVNLSIDTLAVADLPSRLVLLAYLFIVCGLAFALDQANVTLKFW